MLGRMCEEIVVLLLWRNKIWYSSFLGYDVFFFDQIDVVC